MNETSLSLLDALRTTPDENVWRRLVEMYDPLIRAWLRRQGVDPHDADDVAQEVFAVVVRRLPEFQRRPQTGAFRSWLKTITIHCLSDYWRSPRSRRTATGGSEWQQSLQELADPESALSHQWNAEHDRHVSEHLLRMVEQTFEPNTWSAFKRLTLDGLPAAQVAAELGTTINAVYIAKSRVLAKLRELGAGLID